MDGWTCRYILFNSCPQRTMPNERPKSYTWKVLDPNNTPTVKAPLNKAACSGNRRGKVHCLGTTAGGNLSTNLIVAVAAQREARLGKDIVHSLQVVMESYICYISYLCDADDAWARVKLTHSANQGKGARKSHSGLLSFTF
jgi:hypothetical protein